jgi:hypothetical protein
MTMADAGYGRFDLWRDSAKADPVQARELAALLELRASDPDQERTRKAHLELVGVAPGCRVLSWHVSPGRAGASGSSTSTGTGLSSPIRIGR